MRFDDRLATVLGRSPDRAPARVSQWRQIVDILAQRSDADGPLAEDARQRLIALRARIPIDARREAVVAIAGRPLDPAMIAMLADDAPAVAGALLAIVRLDEAGWLALLPHLSPTGRAFLRPRRDLGPRVDAALGAFGTTDFALGGTVDAPVAAAMPAAVPAIDDAVADADAGDADAGDAPAAPAGSLEPGAGEGQIRAIISRIARFRSTRDDPVPPPPASEFRFETGPGGIIIWVEGAPRGPLVGETIAVPADGPFGVDAQAPGAFRRRAPFRDARLTVAGDSAAGGEWRIAGVPVFAPADGRFLGYRCTARRPHAGETAAPRASVDPDTLRQLVHELRTPINAIGGFGEMIRREMRGPVAEPYRVRARAIVDEAARLMTAVDDLDVSARLDSDRLGLHLVTVDLAPLVDGVIADHAEALPAGVVAPTRVGDASLRIVGDVAAIRRMVARLLSATLAVAGADDAVRIAIAAGPDGTVELSLPRVARLADIAEADLLDPGFEAGGGWPDAPLLGLGFSLHLVRRLAHAVGGTLAIEARRLVLRLPAAETLDDAGLG